MNIASHADTVATDASKVPAVTPALEKDESRLEVLDGWRALSILMVMAGHWLPLGPRWFNLNEQVAAGGMAIFFTLSGFLITSFLHRRPEPRAFLIRRLLRILPLAWFAMLILYFAQPASLLDLAANLSFVANLAPERLMEGGAHLWSLCVEMQFYLGVALLVALGGRRSLLLLPLGALVITALRIRAGETISIYTQHRLDEILAGATLALVHLGAFGPRPVSWLRSLGFWPSVAIAAVCLYFIREPVAYLRPYAIALMVGVSIYQAPALVLTMLKSRPAAYIAKISYALYVYHAMLTATWLGSGDKLTLYAKRPLLAAATWAAAHVSTFFYEQKFIDLGRRLTRRPEPHPLTAI